MMNLSSKLRWNRNNGHVREIRGDGWKQWTRMILVMDIGISYVSDLLSCTTKR